MAEPASHRIIGARGERRQVTALFVDVVGFSHFASSADAEELQDWLDGFYGQARQVVSGTGGEITEFLGDGVVAVFGLERAEELAARKAVEAGLALVGGRALAFPDGTSAPLRAGVATGEVATRGRSDGSLPRMTGMVTTLAQRLQTAAQPGEVLIAPETRDLLRGALRLSRRQGTELKGFGTMTVYAVQPRQTGTSGRPDREGRPFVGRRAERDRIRDAEGRPCLLVGPAGIGKTTLAGTFLDDDQAGAVFNADALDSGEGYAPFRQWLRSHFDGHQPDFARLRDRFDNLDDDSVLCLALVLGLREGNAMIGRLASKALRDRIEQSLWLAIRDRVPTGVLLFEDLHWLDSASFGVLRRLVTETAGGPHRLLMTSRDDQKIDRHLGDLPVEIIPLDTFAPAESQAYLDAVCDDGLDAATRDRVIRHAGGVPLYLEQLLRHAAGQTPGSGDLPATLSDLLTERIDAAGPARFVLLQAAVLGRRFSQRLLEALAAPAEDIPAMLESALQADILKRNGPDRWQFSHALLQRAAYRQLLRGTREALHARVAELLQGACADLPEASPATLASHQSRAKLFLPASASYLAASRQALLRGAFADAENHARSALAMCAQDPDAPGRAATEIAAHTSLGSTLMQSQGYAAAPVQAAFAEVLRLASDDAPSSANGAALFGNYSHAIIAGDRARADELCRLLADAADAADEDLRADRIELRLAASAAANCGHFYSGEFRDQFAHLDVIRQHYDLARHAPMIAQYGMDIFAAAQMFEVPARMFCGQAHLVDGLLDETDRHQQALSIPVMQPYALIWGSVPLHAAGRIEAAEDRLRRGMAIAAEQGAEFWLLIGTCWQHVITPSLSDRAEGRAAFKGAIDTLRMIGALTGLPYFTAHYAAALARAGQVDEGLAVAQAAVADGQQSRLLCWQAETLRLYAGIARKAGQPDMARAGLRDAIALASDQGAHLWHLRAALDLADLPGGDADPLRTAETHFTDAATLDRLRRAHHAQAC